MSQPFNLLDHLEYARLRIIRALLYYLGASVIGYIVSPSVIAMLAQDTVGTLVFLSPAEAFFSRLKLSFALGLVIGLPFILYQVWGLAEPALSPRHKRAVWILLPVAYALFLAGIVFAFVTVLPFALDFLLGFGAGLSQEISIAHFISFVISFVLPFGLVFQVPIVVIFLARIGVLRPGVLKANRKYVVLVAFIVATVLTPPDVVSQIMLALPLLALYEVSVLIATIVQPKGDDATDGVESVDVAGTKD